MKKIDTEISIIVSPPLAAGGYSVMTQWSVKIILVCNTDLFKKMSKIGLYLVCILRNWSVFSKMLTNKLF